MKMVSHNCKMKSGEQKLNLSFVHLFAFSILSHYFLSRPSSLVHRPSSVFLSLVLGGS